MYVCVCVCMYVFMYVCILLSCHRWTLLQVSLVSSLCVTTQWMWNYGSKQGQGYANQCLAFNFVIRNKIEGNVRLINIFNFNIQVEVKSRLEIAQSARNTNHIMARDWWFVIGWLSLVDCMQILVKWMLEISQWAHNTN